MRHACCALSCVRKAFFAIALTIGLLLGIASLATAQNTPVFNGPRDYVAGFNSDSLIVADFNGDGLPDFAVANFNSANVSVFLQNSNGTFQTAVNYAVGNEPAAIRSGDVNGDGKQDLLVMNTADNTLSALLGNGDGTFQTQIVTSLPASAPAQSILAVGNFNSDNFLDLAIPGPLPQVGTFGVGILLGNGDGTFQAPVSYPISAQALNVAAADFNNDGKLDIAALTTSGLSVLLGNGEGTFQAAVDTALTGSPFPDGLVFADFNQDGNLDIATSTGLNGLFVTLLYGNGNGTFQVQQLVSVGGIPVAAGDLNGDGKPDLIVAYAFDGSGPFGPVQSLLNTGSGNFTLVSTSYGSVSSPEALALSDLQGNGKLGLISTGGSVSTQQSIVSVTFGNGDGSFATFPSYLGAAPVSGKVGFSFGTLAAADFNGDQKPDLGESFYSNEEGFITTYAGSLLNTGAGFSSATATQLTTPEPGTGYNTWAVAGLFGGNSNEDLIVGDLDVAELLGNGDGTFQDAVYYGSQMSGPLGTGDFNNDGNLDILGTGPLNDTFSVLLGAGNGTFGLPVISPITPGIIKSVATANFNKDANLDIAAVVSTGGSSLQGQVFLGNGDGTFSAGTTLSVPNNAEVVATGDLNGDGNPDVVMALSSFAISGGTVPDSVYVFLGNGDGTFQNPVITTGGCGVVSMMVADFDGDGKQDVAISNSCWNDVGVLLGNGDGSFQTPQYFSSAAGALAVADFDGNGRPDLAVAQPSGAGFLGDAIFLLLNASAGGSAALVSPTSLTFASETVGQTSAAQTVVLMNTNSSALSISGIAISGAQSGDYAQTNNCGSSLASGGSCAISVTFTAQAAGTRNATVQITNSAINSPQLVSLTGTGTAAPGFTWGMASGGSNSATISAGQSATFNLTLTPTGSFSGTVNLVCAITPAATPAPTCSVPSSVSLTGSSATAVTVSVGTTAASTSSGLPLFDPRPPASIIGGLLGLGAFGLMLLTSLRRWRIFVAPAVLAVLLFSWGCGGSSSSTTTTTNAGTPAGAYTVTITSTSGSLTNQTTVTVTVQ